MLTPEQAARKQIDRQLTAAGWHVQDKKRLNLHAAPGIALCEMDVDAGFADYMLFVDAKANLDIFWLNDNSVTDASSLPKPTAIAAEIVELLEEALEEFRALEEELKAD